MTLLPGFLRRRPRALGIVRDTVAGVWEDGFTHAGNLAYLSLLTLFPFFIVVATVAGTLGRTEDGMRAVTVFLKTLPPDVAALVAQPIVDFIGRRASGGLLTLGILVTLWSVSGFMETIRAIIRNAYKSTATGPIWRYRIGSILIIFAAVVVMLAALASQVLLSGAQTFVAELMPLAGNVFATLGFSRLVPAVAIFGALYATFLALTPSRYRLLGCPIWPGALVTTLTWVGTTMGMPPVIGLFGGYSLTYGSLAGVIVALLFFYIIGLGLVVGAHLNAALAEARQERLKTVGVETK